MPNLTKQVNKHALRRHCFASSKTTDKSLKDFSQYSLRGEKQVMSKGWSISITCGGSFLMWIPSHIAFSITAVDMCTKCPSNVNSSGLSITCCQNNRTTQQILTLSMYFESFFL